MKTLILLILNIFVALAAAAKKENAWPVDKKCDVDGPGTIVTFEVLPWLRKTLDEMDELTTRLLDGLSNGIAQLEPQVDRSPMYHLDREKYFGNIKANLNAYYTEVYEAVVTSWVNLTRVHERFDDRFGRLKNPYSCVFAIKSVGGYHPFQYAFADLHHMALKVEESYYRAAGTLRSILKELSVTTTAMVSTSLVVLSETLHLQTLGKEDHDRLLLNNIERVAPNFLGKLMTKLVKSGNDPDSVPRINSEVLAELEPVHQALQYQLRELHEHCFVCSLMPEMYRTLWRSQTNASLQRTKRRPKFSSDFSNIYENEEFLSEVVLSLMMSFKNEPLEVNPDELEPTAKSRGD
ncbi:uncharacterized protein LOC108670182 [Hyalella azteca]|uniref:Uncharacterized protein LOC108670182 n=1 Tax=Hyalella azteca TaxID=294128 RepID=A0A8B7NIE4_HYAAZ|nr:uncharacterized protein LOC108670182 [Hyalella azteca]